MAFLYRGAGPGSYWHVHDPFHLGFTPYAAGQTPSTGRLIQHIARASVTSPYISFTRSYGIARAYAVVGPGGYATTSIPGYVYEVDISDDKACRVVDPASMQTHLQKYCLFPPGSQGTPRTPHLSEELEGLVRALRDSEVLVQGNVPASLLRNRYEVS
jgi:hypothetical protein